MFERPTASETWFYSIVIVLLVVVAFKVAASLLTGSPGRVFTVLLPGFLLISLGVVAARLYWAADTFPQIIGGLAALFVLVIPLTRFLQSDSVFNSFFLWVVTLAVAVIVMIGVDRLSEFVTKWQQEGSSWNRTELLKDFSK
jgi:hypothetical protein